MVGLHEVPEPPLLIVIRGEAGFVVRVEIVSIFKQEMMFFGDKDKH